MIINARIATVLALLVSLLAGQASLAFAEAVRLPDGSLFEFWDDLTRYSKAYHVAQKHPNAADDNPGTADRPFKSIGAAAAILRPTEKVVVHEGIYRECVRPARGGEGPDRMIAYEAAPGEDVWVKGSEVWRPDVRPSAGFASGPVLASGATRWTADLPAHVFGGYNPFLARNITSNYRQWGVDWYAEETDHFLWRRGAIFVNGRPLRQGLHMWDVGRDDGTFVMEEDGLRVHFRLPVDADPSAASYEITARAQVFAPELPNLGYLRVTGFTFEHGAGSLPPPQYGLVSTTRGHHWIIEDNTIRWTNAVGLDIGRQRWNSDKYEPSGHHIVRRNVVSDCGICGIAGWTGVNGTLVEDNLVERIGALDVERLYECGGLKFHVPENVLIRRNVFRHITDAAGIWLDVRAKNCRITGNVFADIESRRGAIHMEQSHEADLIDSNVFWDLRIALLSGEPEEVTAKWGGRAILAENTDHLMIAHNLFGNVSSPGWPVEFSLLQSERILGGRSGLGRRNSVLNNVFVGSRKHLRLARQDNRSDGNLFDAAVEKAPFGIRYLAPEPLVNLSAWQEFFGFDTHSTQARIEAEFDPDTLTLVWRIDGELPTCDPVPQLGEGAERPPGPFAWEQWKRSISGGYGRQRFPSSEGGNPALGR